MKLVVFAIISTVYSIGYAAQEFEGKGVQWLSQTSTVCSVTTAQKEKLTVAAKKKAIAHGMGQCKGIADRDSKWVIVERCHLGSSYGGPAAFKVHASANFDCLGTEQGHDLP